MESAVQNKRFHYSVFFKDDTAWISISDLSNEFYKSVVTLPIKVWDNKELQRQQFETYHQGQVPITENQIKTHAMGHEFTAISGHCYVHFAGDEFCPCYVAGNIEFSFTWEE